MWFYTVSANDHYGGSGTGGMPGAYQHSDEHQRGHQEPPKSPGIASRAFAFLKSLIRKPKPGPAHVNDHGHGHAHGPEHGHEHGQRGH